MIISAILVGAAFISKSAIKKSVQEAIGTTRCMAIDALCKNIDEKKKTKKTEIK